MMKRKGIILSLLFGGLFCNQLSAQTDNVLVIVADDLGVDYMNRYDLGTDPAPTPVLDSLSDNGILFNNAWTNPICSPSRANMLTGKYAFRTGIGTAITGLQNTPLDTSEYTIAKAVRDQQSVATAMVGKWHLGHSTQAFRRNPNACGFDLYSGNIEGQLPNYSIWQKTVNGSNSNIFDYATSVAVDDAINWIDNRTTDWMLFLTFNAPHEPFHRPPNNLHSFDNISTNPIIIAQDPTQHFKAMIEAMDTEIGRLLEHLRSTGELEHTDIIFIGDNGSPADVAQAPYSSTKVKASLYNGGVQVPLIISGPSVISPGRNADELVNSTDLYHTILELFGGSPASLPNGTATDSRTLLPIITNSSDSGSQRSWIYGDLFKPIPANRDGKAITDGIYKLIEFDNGTTEFYNIDLDYFENAPLNVGSLSATEQDHYDFLCGELSALLDTNFCQLPTALFDNYNVDVGIYPNPVAETLQVRFDGSVLKAGSEYTGHIYNAAGAIVQAFRVETANQSISVGQLPPAVYYFTLSENGETISSATFVKHFAGAVK